MEPLGYLSDPVFNPDGINLEVVLDPGNRQMHSNIEMSGAGNNGMSNNRVVCKNVEPSREEGGEEGIVGNLLGATKIGQVRSSVEMRHTEAGRAEQEGSE
ncbi:hypothetical protein Dimus_004315, partial [Dionaea muscipula]